MLPFVSIMRTIPPGPRLLTIEDPSMKSPKTMYSPAPLAIFSGFNHYKGGVIFGATLLYDETIETFQWLFETFLCAHKNVRPLTVLTNQDAAMARVLKEVMPDVRHALCTWHISKNAMKHLPNSIASDFNHYMYDC